MNPPWFFLASNADATWPDHAIPPEAAMRHQDTSGELTDNLQLTSDALIPPVRVGNAVLATATLRRNADLGEVQLLRYTVTK
jgi:hypothetical protein